MGITTRQAARWVDWAIIAVMAVLGIFMLLPFAWLISMSFRPVVDSYKMPPSFFPTTFDFANYAAVLKANVPFLQIYINSVEIAVIVTIGQLVTCTLAAFAFSRLNFKFRDALFFILLIGLMFPAQVTILPIYLGYAKLGLINKPIGLALMYLTSSFGVFLMRQFMDQVKRVGDAAKPLEYATTEERQLLRKRETGNDRVTGQQGVLRLGNKETRN